MHPEMPFLRLSLYLPVLLGAFALLVLGWEYELFADSGSVRNSTERLESGELTLVGGFITLGLLAVSLVNRRLMLHHSRRRAVAEEEAVRDPLTGLSNRRSFLASVERALRAPMSLAEPCALLLIDLDRFKPVNDRHGHAAGDAVLIEVARRLTASFPARLDVARLGGDEFALVLPPRQHAVAQAFAESERFARALERPIEFNGAELMVGASVGIAFGPAMGDSPIALLAAADKQMYLEKRASTRRREPGSRKRTG